MRPLIQNISEITDSRELLESKLHPFLTVFIYLLLILIATAFAWSYFGEIDDYVKANGVVRPNEKISSIKNKITGKVETVNYEEGKTVKKGDVLFTIEHANLDLEKEAVIKLLTKTKQELNNLKKLKRSIIDGKNYFDRNAENQEDYNENDNLFIGTNNMYHTRYIDYRLNVQKLQNIVEQNKDEYQSLQQLVEYGAVTQKEVDDAEKALDRAKLELQKYRGNTLVQIDDTIEATEKTIESLNKDLDSINIKLSDCVVTSPIDGIINVTSEINKGDLLQSGVEVATVVPRTSSQYKVQLYVSNKDIANIKEGQKIKYHFLALPYREYGELEGTITKIGTDSRTEQRTGNSFYMVEAGIENKPLYSYKGEKAEIKVGMACEAHVIIRSKKILYYVLEKINLME